MLATSPICQDSHTALLVRYSVIFFYTDRTTEYMISKDWREFKWLAGQSRPSFRLQLFALLCTLASSLLVILDPLIVKWIIDDLLPGRKMKWLPAAASAFLAAYGGRLLFDALGMLLSFQAVQKVVFHLRLGLIHHLHALSASFHESKPVGDTLQRIQQEVDLVGQLGGEAVPALIRLLVVTPLVLGTMFVLSPRLTCILTPMIPLFVLVRRSYHTRLRTCTEAAQACSGKVSAFLQEHLAGIIQVQLLTQEKAAARRFTRLSISAFRAQVLRKRVEVAFYVSSAFVVFAGVAGVLGYGGYEVITGSLSVGGLVAFYSYAMQLFGPIHGVVDIYSKLNRLSASLRRILEIMQTETTIADRKGAAALSPSAERALEFSQVGFRYKSGAPVLENLSLRVRPGEKVALVGGSGAGKTTIVKLIARLYDVTNGSLQLAGRDVRDIRLRSLRSIVSVVPQEVTLFEGSLLDNLILGAPRASEWAVKDAIRVAQLQTLINRLPRGVNEPVGPRGSKLSGGERQRVALARAILRKPGILILDEPTSALDEPTGCLLLDALRECMADVTLILITHRPSAISWADRVVVLDHGRIVKEDAFPKQEPGALRAMGL
jgi:ABC-type multidrug transport system fused ATPase/permease subunit